MLFVFVTVVHKCQNNYEDSWVSCIFNCTMILFCTLLMTHVGWAYFCFLSVYFSNSFLIQLLFRFLWYLYFCTTIQQKHGRVLNKNYA